MENFVLFLTGLGAFAFGVVVGWVTYRTLRRSQVSGLSDIATVIGAVGGAAVTALFPIATGAFGAYCIGLAIGFFAYLRVAINLANRHGGEEARQIEWLGGLPSIDAREDLGRSRSVGRSGVSGGGLPGPG
jgi:hypothetical protein